MWKPQARGPNNALPFTHLLRQIYRPRAHFLTLRYDLLAFRTHRGRSNAPETAWRKCELDEKAATFVWSFLAHSGVFPSAASILCDCRLSTDPLSTLCPTTGSALASESDGEVLGENGSSQDTLFSRLHVALAGPQRR